MTSSVFLAALPVLSLFLSVSPSRFAWSWSRCKRTSASFPLVASPATFTFGKLFIQGASKDVIAMTTVLVLCVQVINLNSALCRLCNAHWPLQRGFRVHWVRLGRRLSRWCWALRAQLLLCVYPFVFLVHSTRCAMLRRTFVFLMLVINNLSCAPLLSDDGDEKTMRWARRRWGDYALLLSLLVCPSFYPVHYAVLILTKDCVSVTFRRALC